MITTDGFSAVCLPRFLRGTTSPEQFAVVCPLRTPRCSQPLRRQLLRAARVACAALCSAVLSGRAILIHPPTPSICPSPR
jgi:hypothetical protein